MAGGISFGQNAEDSGTNLVPNGGFEVEGPVGGVNTAEEPYKTLQERGAGLPDRMPESVQMNPAHGWGSEECKFEYLNGLPDDEVHSGNRAIRITSPAMESGITVRTGIPVIKESKADSEGIVVGIPCKFSLYVKGQGTVAVTCYLYGTLGNLYDANLRTISPARFDVDADKWELVEGTLTINDPSVAQMVLVIEVKGEVSLDDVTFFANSGQ